MPQPNKTKPVALRIGTGKPGPGRPKKRECTTSDGVNVYQLCRDHSRKAIALMVKVMNDKDQPIALRLRCCDAIIERGFGKPTTSVIVDAQVSAKNKEIDITKLDESRLIQLLGTMNPELFNDSDAVEGELIEVNSIDIHSPVVEVTKD